jgi:uncharacterized protein (TIGR02611 family)
MAVTIRIARILAGFVLLLAGVAMLALPGPGWLTIAAGLALLASEFAWARRALDRLEDAARRAGDVIRRRRPRRGEPADQEESPRDR